MPLKTPPHVAPASRTRVACKAASAALFAAFLALGTAASAQSVATTPVGAITVTVAASPTGTSYSTTNISAPLLNDLAVADGQGGTVLPAGATSGRFTGVGPNSFTVTGAGWTSGQLAQAVTPVLVSIQSGNARGRFFLVTGNTNDTLTLNTQGTDLTTLGIDLGADMFQLKSADTLLTLLGTPADGIVGGNATAYSNNQTDRIILNNISGNTLLTYYYNTEFGQWRRAGSAVNQSNTVILPTTGIIYQRISTQPLSLTLVGEVPVGRLSANVPTVGTHVMARFFPTDTTLGALGLENLPNWRRANSNGITVADSDRAIVKVGASLLSYYYDDSVGQWRRAGSALNQTGVTVGAGTSVQLLRKGSANTSDLWNLESNYTL